MYFVIVKGSPITKGLIQLTQKYISSLLQIDLKNQNITKTNNIYYSKSFYLLKKL